MSKYQPDMYHSMKKHNSLDDYVSSVRSTVKDYVDRAVDRAMESREYLEAQSRGDFETMRKICNSERMFATSDAERMWVCVDDDELREKLNTFEGRISEYSLYGYYFQNIYFDEEKQEYLRINEEDLDEYGNDEYGDHYPTYDEIRVDMRSQWYDLYEQVYLIDDPDRRYEISRYLELVFDNFYGDPCVDELRKLFIEDAAEGDEDSPIRNIVNFYINNDEDGLSDYIHYRDIPKKHYNEAIAGLKALDRQRILRDLQESVSEKNFERAYELAQSLSDALKACREAAEELEEVGISADEM